MDRLTYRDETGKAWAKLDAHADAEETMSFGRIALDRLAAYEDTGLTPKDLKEVQKALGKTSLNELYDILSAKQEGRLVILPCDENDK